MEKYKKLQKHVKEYTAAELRQELGNVSIAYLIRTIILNERDYPQVNYTRSLRSFWYSTVKPTLDKLGLLTESATSEDSLTKWDSELSRYMADLARAGELRYTDLNIRDNSRQRNNPREIYRTTNIDIYGFKVATADNPNIVLCTEKDTVYTIVEDIAQLFGVSCISGKGQNSLGAMEDLLQGMEKDNDILFLSMTDFDPAGFTIANTFAKQAADLANSLNISGRVFHRRIGINPQQLTAEQVQQNKYTPKGNLKKWVEETGGINGEPKGLELDAFEPDMIRTIFADTLKHFISPQAYDYFIKEAYIKTVLLRHISSKIQTIATDAIEKEAGNLQFANFDIFDLCKEGANSLPIQNACLPDRDLSICRIADNYFTL